MTLQQLKYAIKVVDIGSFSKAADELYIAQPSLSNAIKELEKEVGICLFKRSNKGVYLSPEGEEFLVYARQVILQAQLLEEKYLSGETTKLRFGISTHHYAFAASAFVDMVKNMNAERYEFAIRETTTQEIIEDVSSRKSELGMIYLSNENDSIILKLLKEHKIIFEEILKTSPHVLVNKNHPLKNREKLQLEELSDYPYISFEQKKNNSFYFSEEILSARKIIKSIKVSDRAAVMNLLTGLEGYTIATGVFPRALYDDIISIPLDSEETIRVGIIYLENIALSEMANIFIEALRKYID